MNQTERCSGKDLDFCKELACLNVGKVTRYANYYLTMILLHIISKFLPRITPI
jgi:hypothetical protein